MNIDKVRPLFGEWFRFFEEFCASSEFDKIFAYLKSRTSQGIKVFPNSKDVFRCFRETPPDKLKVILTGFAPYHNSDSSGTPFADGLMMSNSYSKYQKSPSLSILYTGIENDLCKGLDLEAKFPNSLEYLAHQGVLLTNIGLTVEAGRAGSHTELWENFNRYFWEEIINKYFRGLVVIYFGREAAKSEKYLQNLLHYPMIVDHPASAAYKGGTWDHKQVFSRCNQILKQNNGEEIQWICKDETCPF